MPKASPIKTDLLVARHTARKVERIVEKTWAAFHAAAQEWGTMSLDETLAIGTTLFVKIAVEPAEKMSTNPREMRRQLGFQLQKMIRQEGDEIVN